MARPLQPPHHLNLSHSRDWVNTYIVKLPLGRARGWAAKKLRYASPQAKLVRRLEELSYNSSAVSHRAGNRVQVSSSVSKDGGVVTKVLFQFTLPRRTSLTKGLGQWIAEGGSHEHRKVAGLLYDFGQRDEQVRKKLLEAAKGLNVTCFGQRVHYDAQAAAKG